MGEKDGSNYGRATHSKIRIEGIDLAWDVGKGTATFQGLPVAMMWVDTTLAWLMSGLQATVGPERFLLALQAEGRKSVEADWQVISRFDDFQEGFKAIAGIAAVAGWGAWTLASMDADKRRCCFRVTDGWEGRYQKALGVSWGSGMLAGKMAGYCSNLFLTNCWADQTKFEAKGDPYDEFVVGPSQRTVEDEIGRLLSSDLATRADMAVALKMLETEVKERRQAQEALTHSEDKYRTLVEESFDGVFVQTGPKIVFANSRLCEMLGYTEAELVGKDHWEVYHPDFQELTRSRAQARMRGEPAPAKYEVRLQRKDGSSFDGEINAKSVTIGGQAGVQVWIRDITERKIAEQSLRESEERYRELFDNSADMIYTQDLRGDYTSVNRAVQAVLGYTAEEFTKLNFRHIVDPEYLEMTEEYFTQKLNGVVDRTGPYEVLVHAKGGERVWLEINSRIITDNGKRIGIHGTARDVTERKNARGQLTKLFAAVEQAGESIVMTDPTGRIEYVNPSFEATTGYTPEEVIGQNLRILKSGRQGADFYKDMWKTVSEGSVWRGRLTNKRKDGTLYEETETISPIKDNSGRIVNFVAVKRDITSEAMLEKQLLQAQKMEAIGTLAGGIAHDINNLLQAVLGYSDILLVRKGYSDPDRKPLEIIQHAARDGAELVSRILTFSRKGEFKVRPMDLNDKVRRVENLLRRTIPRMIEIDLLLAGDLNIIDGDPAQIEQVILNLGVNAQHAMPEGGRLVIETCNVSMSDEYLMTHLDAKPGKYVLLAVSDTGQGMEPDVLDRIFEPFFTTKTNGEGTGLGLAMVHGIVAQHGGYIRCYSERGRGTCFKIYFPVSASAAASDMSITRDMPAFGAETILLVDDDDRIRDLGGQLIGLGGYEVISVRSGEEAIRIFANRKEEISLVILDLIMPGMGGTRCLQELLRIDPDVKVLLASGYSSNGVATDQERAGARGFISKPYDAKAILAAIRNILDKGRL
jgi:PAS domain S-box-containing protein